MTTTTRISDTHYEITIETNDMESFEAIMKVVYEQKDREAKECGKKSQPQ